MRDLRQAGLALFVGIALLVFTGFAPRRTTTPQGVEDEMARHIAALKSGKAQQKAAAAYWLGQQRAAAALAVDSLVVLLGDATEVDPAQYRARRLDKMTLGEEVAAALVNIGYPAIDPLIKVLKTSPQPEARKNAAWALGALHDTGATGGPI